MVYFFCDEIAVTYLHFCKQQSHSGVDYSNYSYIIILTVLLDFSYDLQCSVSVEYDSVEIYFKFVVQLVLSVIKLAVA